MSRGDQLGLGLVGLVLVGALTWMAIVVNLEDEVSTGPEDAHAVPVDEGPARVDHAAASEEVFAAVQPEHPPVSSSKRWTDLNSLAIEALEAGRLQQAVDLFEQCHEGEPQEPVFAANLAEALARLARSVHEATAELEQPIEWLERAVSLAPARQDLVALLARWRRVAETEEGFWTDETAHFRLSYDGNRDDILNRGHDILTSALEEAYAEFVLQFNHDPVRVGDPKIKVVLYAREEFSELTGIGHWAGGVYDGVVRIPVVDFSRERKSLVRVMRHELIHAFLRSAGGSGVPAWLNEGLAQWHEHEHAGTRDAAIQRARSKLAGQRLFPLEELRGTLAAWTDEEEISRGYAQALALMAYIVEWYGERVLYEMVEGCARGDSCQQTFTSRIGVGLGAVLEDLEGSL